MKKITVMFLSLSIAFVNIHSDYNKTNLEEAESIIHYTIESHSQKFFIGFELRTDNQKCSLAMPIHKDRFFNEGFYEKIPNKVNGDILALYTDYEGDCTKPYSWILGCEVSNLDEVPDGLVARVIPSSSFAVYTTQGKFPEGLIAAWQSIWSSNLSRAYTTDFELYKEGFNPDSSPEVKVYIAID